MKVVNTVVKIATALAAVAGAVYLLATYGDKIVAWAKKVLNCGCCVADSTAADEDCQCGETSDCQDSCDCEQTPAQETPVQQPAPETPAQQEPQDDVPSAREEDFE